MCYNHIQAEETKELTCQRKSLPDQGTNAGITIK
jgi:hypothetical protein